MEARISLSFARSLKRLLNGEQVNAADFQGSSQQLLEQFLNDGVLEYNLIGSQRKKIFCSNSTNLVSYVHNKFEIPSLEKYIAFREKKEFGRSDAVKAASDSKIRKTKVFTGFLVNTYEPLACELDQREFLVKPSKGAFFFISDYKSFKIPEDVTVVIVENHENFREIERQRYLFNDIMPLFVWRYQNSNAISEWLNLAPNPYMYFGDFDPKGIQIYISEFRNKINGSRGRFFIPDNIENLISTYGEKALYEKQKDDVKLIDLEQPTELRAIFELITKYKKGLAQEVLIND